MSKRTPLQQLQESLNDLLGQRTAITRLIDFKQHLINEQRRNANAARKAHRLNARYPDIVIDKGDAPGEWWVTHKVFNAYTGPGDTSVPEDPLEGNHFCVGGVELLEAVEVYVNYIERQQP